MTRNNLYSLIFVFALLLLINGCESGNSPSKYVPQKVVARNAVESSLSAWKSGTPYGTIEGKPAINVFDARWQAGDKLESFEILEEVLGEDHPKFKVRLKLENAEVQENAYLVVGIDPLLVFRDEDYRRTSGL